MIRIVEYDDDDDAVTCRVDCEVLFLVAYSFFLLPFFVIVCER
jgi:hypothetical protein